MMPQSVGGIPVTKALATVTLALMGALTTMVKMDAVEMKDEIGHNRRSIEILERSDATHVQAMHETNRRLADLESQADRIEEKIDNLRLGVAPGASDSEYRELIRAANARDAEIRRLREDTNRLLQFLSRSR